MALPWIIGAVAVAAVGAIAKSISDDNEREREREREREIERERERLEKREEEARERARQAAREEAKRREEAKKQEKKNFAREQLNVLFNDLGFSKSSINFDELIQLTIENKQSLVTKRLQEMLNEKHKNNGQLAKISNAQQKINELNFLLRQLGE